MICWFAARLGDLDLRAVPDTALLTGLAAHSRLQLRPVDDGVGATAETDVVAVLEGTSGTVFAHSPHPIADPTGVTSGFADATGAYLPLLCTLNAARVMARTSDLLGTDLDEFDALAAAGDPDCSGLTLLPYLDGERTPNLPDATASLGGMTLASTTRENLARSAIEGMLCGLADGLDATGRLVPEEEGEFVVDAALAVVQVGVADTARLDRDHRRRGHAVPGGSPVLGNDGDLAVRDVRHARRRDGPCPRRRHAIRRRSRRDL